MNLCVNAIKKIRELPKYKVIENGSHRSLAPKLLPDTSSKMAAELASSIVSPKLVIRPSSISLSRVDKKHSSLTGGSVDRQRKISISSIADLTGKFHFWSFLAFQRKSQVLLAFLQYLNKS